MPSIAPAIFVFPDSDTVILKHIIRVTPVEGMRQSCASDPIAFFNIWFSNDDSSTHKFRTKEEAISVRVNLINLLRQQ